MPKFARGNMWDVYHEVDLFCITTNSYVKANGALVMGRGIAKQARDRFPELDLKWGQFVTDLDCVNGIYHLLVSWPSDKLVAFQVKTHFRNQAGLDIIRGSVDSLTRLALYEPGLSIALNYPGIGFGRLGKGDVAPILDLLPGNVTVWTF